MKFYEKFHPDGFYHIFNHAVGTENLFRTHRNYLFFLARYQKYLHPVMKTFCYCLMPNHFHLLVQIRDEESIRAMAKVNAGPEFDYHKFVMQQLSNFLNSYAKAFNKENNRKGALFLDFTKRKKVEDQFYFTRLTTYIHQNPVHHGFVKLAMEWDYSSYNSIVSTKVSNLERKAIFEWFGGIEEFISTHHMMLPIDLEIENL